MTREEVVALIIAAACVLALSVWLPLCVRREVRRARVTIARDQAMRAHPTFEGSAFARRGIPATWSEEIEGQCVAWGERDDRSLADLLERPYNHEEEGL